MPFRFGVITLRHAPQAFIRARIRLSDGREGWGRAAEMMMPKWFDKSPDLTDADNIEQLRRSLACAARLSLDQPVGTAAARNAMLMPAQYAACAAEGYGDLVAAYGPALIERAALDALCRILGLSAAEAVRVDAIGMAADPPPDLAGCNLGAILAELAPAPTIRARHTIGLLDAITESDVTEPLRDGLPESLEGAIATYGLTAFKIKVSGDPEADLDRLTRIAGVLDRGEPYLATLDGNEQYASAEAIADLWHRIAADARLARLSGAIAFIEQPIARDRTFEEPVHALAALRPVLIDESGAAPDAFARARALGYAGISSKSCKGFFDALANRARVAVWGGGAFMSAEDLTTQAGVSVQQDLALAALIGATHVERNGHHYVDGFTGSGADPAEAHIFLAKQTGLYQENVGPDGEKRVRLRIDGGRIDLRSLAGPGLGGMADPDWDVLEPMALA
jgi:hypothetical protein